MQTIRNDGEIVEAEASYLRPFLDASSPKDVPAAFAKHIQSTWDFLAALPESKAEYAYAPSKWSVRQVVAHILDAHVIFQYRALCIARGENQTLLPFDENLYAGYWSQTQITLAQLAQAYHDVSRATLTLGSLLVPEAWARRGIANRIRISPELIYRVIMGHEQHHACVIQERYLSP
jgi:uncharacterized damage-inducible protein DinB